MKTGKYFIFGIIAITTLALLGVIYFGSKENNVPKVDANTKTELSVDSDTFDWGEIDINSGKVSKTFIIENKGAETLKLYNIQTSCMCTTAQIKVGPDMSKKFGMHESTSSVVEVKPDEKAELIVEFDPAFHGPSGIGSISRIVTMSTNDTNHSTLSFRLTADVVKK